MEQRAAISKEEAEFEKLLAPHWSASARNCAR